MRPSSSGLKWIKSLGWRILAAAAAGFFGESEMIPWVGERERWPPG